MVGGVQNAKRKVQSAEWLVWLSALLQPRNRPLIDSSPD